MGTRQRITSPALLARCSRRVTLFDVAGLVHRRHDEKIDVGISFSIRHATGVSVQNAIFENLRVDLAVFPRWRRSGSMQPAQVILIHGIFDHLKKIAIHRPRSPRSNSVFPHQHVPARQKRGRLGSKISENHTAQLLSFISRVTNPLSEGTVGRLAGHFQDPPFDIIKPAMIAAAQTAILQMAKFQRSSAMRAAQAPAVPADFARRERAQDLRPNIRLRIGLPFSSLTNAIGCQ